MPKKKHELLVPVGSWNALVAAINNGADAVYLGGKRFGARAFADNFSEEEIEKAAKLCHLYDVKIYVTVNTLVRDNEIEDALVYIKLLHKIGVDAVIMQDVGLINLVHQTLPNLEIHASTQMHNHSSESLKFLENLGVKRVVFARELSLDYINEINTSLEKEVFIHGALCISYSGQCLFSACILNRSGNRGECAGMCRLPYRFLENGKYIGAGGEYLLSPKDLCSIANFKKLMDSNVTCFKIEGRMKSPAYVAVVTRIYKNLMTQYENGEELKVKQTDFELLQAIFNRDYTRGFLFNDNDIMNYSAPNHQGIHLGKVLSVNPKKIKIKLDYSLKQFEGIRFKESNIGINTNFIYDEDNNLINSAKNGDIIYLDNFIKLKSLDEVLLTMPLVDLPSGITKKVKVDITCEAYINKNIILKVNDGINEIVLAGDIVQESITSPVTKERLNEAIAKVGNTPFEINTITINLDQNIFIAIGSLNKLRREALVKLKELRENQKTKYQENVWKNEPISYQDEGYNINVLVRNEAQKRVCQKLGIKNIIVDNPSLMEEGLIYKVPRDNISHNYPYAKLLVTDYASLDKYPNNISDYSLNVFNHYTFDYLKKYAKSIMLSPELNISDIQNLMQDYPKGANAEVLVYGRIELMILKHCPLNKNVHKDGICCVCQNGQKYELEDRNKARYPLISNPLTHGTTVLHYKTIDFVSQIIELKHSGVKNYRIEFWDESYEEAKAVLLKFIQYI